MLGTRPTRPRLQGCVGYLEQFIHWTNAGVPLAPASRRYQTIHISPGRRPEIIGKWIRAKDGNRPVDPFLGKREREREGRRVLGLGSSVIRERLVKWIYVENGSFLFLIKVLTYSSTRSEKNIIRNLFIVVQFDFKSLLALNREMEYIQLLLFSVCVTK